MSICDRIRQWQQRTSQSAAHDKKPEPARDQSPARQAVPKASAKEATPAMQQAVKQEQGNASNYRARVLADEQRQAKADGMKHPQPVRGASRGPATDHVKQVQQSRDKGRSR